MNYYEILGISKEATFDEIRGVYRTLARKYHPDVNKDSDAADKFKQVNEAHHVLSDPERRLKYDKRGSRVENPFNFSWGVRGQDISSQIIISLEDVFFGCKSKVTYQRSKFCDDCEGSGAKECYECSYCEGKGVTQLSSPPFSIQVTCSACRGVGVMRSGGCSKCNSKGRVLLGDCSISVTVPKGVMGGSRLRISGQGDVGREENGDLYLIVNVKDHSLFVRDNKNLILDVPVSYTQLALGDKLEIPTLNSEKVSINVPAGTISGTKFRLKDLGLPDIYEGVGDLIVGVILEVPKKVSKKYKKILIELSKLEQKVKK
jgi:molecular chaperone DnaJ